MRITALLAGLFAIVAIAASPALPAASAASTNTKQNKTTSTQKPAKTVAQAAPAAAAPAPVVVEVQPGDYLAKIAETHQTTYTRLYEANTEIDHPDLIFPGQKVRVPSANETLAPRALPADAQVPVQEASAYVPNNTAAVAPVQQPTVAPASGDMGVWDRLAQCESGGNWAINTGNGYYGGLQFSLSSWQAVGGSGLPSNASKSEQIARAEMLQARQGWGAWPACTAKLGIR